MERGDGSTLIRDVFKQYMVALGEFFAVFERCAIKGWPDRAAVIRRHIEIQMLFRDQEIARLKYVLDSDSDVSLDSYTRVDLIRRRLIGDWAVCDEETLCAKDAEYVALQQRLENLRRLGPGDVDGPLEMAKTDPELLSAVETLKETHRALDSRLGEFWGAVSR